ncbi:hypothetical protein DPX16_10016 [Anabarilius grahami]|uniref:Uncharacterized protein n=1 Tax=Anabarilius grahami TaxID=495550 RepID=A0A3N0XXA6_ANAGA|nr:hypothetical protein DPX16_10016 [Anabarilius grahami]
MSGQFLLLPRGAFYAGGVCSGVSVSSKEECQADGAEQLDDHREKVKTLSLALGLFLSVCMHSYPSCAKISIQEDTRGLPHHQRAARGEKKPRLSDLGPVPEPLQPSTAASTTVSAVSSLAGSLRLKKTKKLSVRRVVLVPYIYISRYNEVLY